MAEKKSIFSFLFSGSGSKRGARDGSDGSKGLSELKSENTLDVSNHIEKAKDIVSKPTHDTVIQDTTKKRQKNHARLHHRSPYSRRPKDLPRKRLNKRNNEIQDQKNSANRASKPIQKRIEKAPKIDEKVIKNFISRLDPSVQEEIRKNMMEQINKKGIAKRENISQTENENILKKQVPQKELLANHREDKPLDLREKIEQKRGAYRQSKQSKMLETAKKIAEKARNMVKEFRMRITGKTRTNPVAQNVQQNIGQKTKSQTKLSRGLTRGQRER